MQTNFFLTHSKIRLPINDRLKYHIYYHLTGCNKMSFGSFWNVFNKLCIYKSYMNKEILALNNLQGLICHKTPPNQTKPTLLASFLSLWGPFLVCQLRLESQLFSCPTAFLVFLYGLSTCLSFNFLWFSLNSPPGTAMSTIQQVLFKNVFVNYHLVWSSGRY